MTNSKTLGGRTTAYKDLDAETKALIDAGFEAAKKSYSPYSKFAVGAALYAHNEAGEKKLFSGCNVENATYNGGLCAERTAAVKAVSEGYTKFSVMMCVAPQTTACAPCGICRQFLREFGKDGEFIIVMNAERDVERFTMNEILPMSFGPEHLV